ncbi:hypothetical protein Bca101_008997 [Brassica carinata]
MAKDNNKRIRNHILEQPTRIDCLEVEHQTSNVKISDGEGMFLKKDDPKVTALMQQAEFLSSLA